MRFAAHQPTFMPWPGLIHKAMQVNTLVLLDQVQYPRRFSWINRNRLKGIRGKDLIFPQFCQRKGELKIQGFEVLDVFAVIKYLADRFDYKETSFIREGDTAYDLKSKRRWKIRLGEKRKKAIRKK